MNKELTQVIDGKITETKIKALGVKKLKTLCNKLNITYTKLGDISKKLYNSLWLPKKSQILLPNNKTIEYLENIAASLSEDQYIKNKKIKNLLKNYHFIPFSTANVVYLIFNKFTKNFYIGETGRPFSEIRYES